MIAIHFKEGVNFSSYWLDYCQKNRLPYKIVSCYENNIIEQLRGCKALMWHPSNFDYRDQIFAKYLIRSVEEMGLKVFPNTNSVWHYDDKVAQKYLLESISAPLVETFVFYNKSDALLWVNNTTFPKVFKLRRGSGSKNVLLVKSKKHAKILIQKMFSTGMRPISMKYMLKERFRKYAMGKEPIIGLIKGFIRLFIGTPYLKMSANEKGYIYFQEFIPDNSFDIRVTYVNGRCFALRRKVRNNDFRASGSGHIEYDMSKIPKEALKIAFEVSLKLNLQSAAYDFVIHNNKPKIIEVSCLFGYDEDQFNYGYWDNNLKYHPGTFNPYGWMIESLL